MAGPLFFCQCDWGQPEELTTHFDNWILLAYLNQRIVERIFKLQSPGTAPVTKRP
jgi:hypothetical protein